MNGFDSYPPNLALPIFFFGIPLLATLPFGSEFHYRTLSVVLAQPVRRTDIWAEKLTVALVAALSATFVYKVSLHNLFEAEPLIWTVAVMLLITTLCSAAYWTLLTGSTIGGIILSMFGAGCVLAVFALTGNGFRPEDWNASQLTVMTVAGFCYAGVMLWLGRRKMTLFQDKAGTAGDDLLTAGLSHMPDALTRPFESRPTEAFVNLIRKEFRLLRPVWLVAFLSILSTAMLSSLLTVVQPQSMTARVIVILTLACAGTFTTLTTVLSGSLSVGEERTAGTQLWHLTLPISIRRQWAIKLGVGLFTALVCALPVLGIVKAMGLGLNDYPDLRETTAAVLLVSLAAFWCACAAGATIRAILWVCPVVFLLRGAAAISMFVPISSDDLVGYIISRFHPYPISGPIGEIIGSPFILWVAIPVLAVCVAIQSYRMFRTQSVESRPVLRSLLPLLAFAFLCGYAVRLLNELAFIPYGQGRQVMSELHAAVTKLNVDLSKLDAAHPLEISPADLEKAVALSDLTRRWLRGSRITVEPNKGTRFIRTDAAKARMNFSPYSTTLHLPNEWEATAYSNIHWGFNEPGKN